MLDFVPGFFIYLFVMAAVTYLVRMIPLALIRRKITNKFVRSFLYYVPYTVLSAMVFPAIFFSTGNIISASVGAVVAIVLSYFRRSLLTVSAAATLTALATEMILTFF
ncbi:MAG: AzlD domain-containing protein [Clostridia bacterium]|nr:AzlD domain-containing protein [Clostridia bacterium]